MKGYQRIASNGHTAPRRGVGVQCVQNVAMDEDGIDRMDPALFFLRLLMNQHESGGFGE
jgi:hypothetical protein